MYNTVFLFFLKLHSWCACFNSTSKIYLWKYLLVKKKKGICWNSTSKIYYSFTRSNFLWAGRLKSVSLLVIEQGQLSSYTSDKFHQILLEFETLILQTPNTKHDTKRSTNIGLISSRYNLVLAPIKFLYLLLSIVFHIFRRFYLAHFKKISANEIVMLITYITLIIFF